MASTSRLLSILELISMKIKTCYMCDQPVTSREHVPPKCIFPEKKDLPKGFDFRKNLIKVPSCDEHNSHKSMDDEYLMFVLASSPHGNKHKNLHFERKVMRAINSRMHGVECTNECTECTECTGSGLVLCA